MTDLTLVCTRRLIKLSSLQCIVLGPNRACNVSSIALAHRPHPFSLLNCAAWAWAYALHDVLVTQQLSVDEVKSGDVSGGQKKMLAALKRVRFSGPNGQVSFDPTTGDQEVHTMRFTSKKKKNELDSVYPLRSLTRRPSSMLECLQAAVVLSLMATTRV